MNNVNVINRGIDCAVNIGDKVQALYDNGIRFFCRYYLPGSRWRQPLTRDEAQKICAAGHDAYIVSVYEGNPTFPQYFTAEKASYDYTIARHQAVTAGQPFNTDVYFAVDYDARPEDVRAYFIQLNKMAGAINSLAISAYGSKDVIDFLKSKGLIQRGWLAQSKGWAGYSSVPGAEEIQQGREVTMLGLDVDLDFSSGNGGGWRLK